MNENQIVSRKTEKKPGTRSSKQAPKETTRKTEKKPGTRK